MIDVFHKVENFFIPINPESFAYFEWLIYQLDKRYLLERWALMIKLQYPTINFDKVDSKNMESLFLKSTESALKEIADDMKKDKLLDKNRVLNKEFRNETLDWLTLRKKHNKGCDFIYLIKKFALENGYYFIERY